jgi:hypothetical protein
MIPKMSWLLFLDESGHDHKNCPYEVRGGVAIHASMLWPLVQELQAAELSAFGANLREYGKEIKGSKLLDKDRFKWASQSEIPRSHPSERPRLRLLRHHLCPESVWRRSDIKKEIKFSGVYPFRSGPATVSPLKTIHRGNTFRHSAVPCATKKAPIGRPREVLPARRLRQLSLRAVVAPPWRCESKRVCSDTR